MHFSDLIYCSQVVEKNPNPEELLGKYLRDECILWLHVYVQYMYIMCNRALHGPEIYAQARPANMIWGPGPAWARSSCADLARARPANWIMRPGPGPARNNYVQARPGPQNNFIFEAQARARGPRAGPLARPHRPTKQQNYYCVHILMWLLSCYVHNHMYSISNVCVKSSMD